MRRRSKAGGKPVKTRRRKTATLKRRNAPRAVRRSSAASLHQRVALLTRERDEALQQQTVTADVLKVISRARFDLQTVLQTLVESAARLCDADKATITRQKGEVFYRAEAYGFSAEFLDYVRKFPIVPERGSVHGRTLLEGKVVHIADVLADPEYTFVEAQRLGDFRTVLGVPMLREGIPIGALALTRSEVRPFTDKQIELVSTFADQAVIAIENVRLFEAEQQRTRELTESLDQQTATSEVLQVISSSPGDLQPVFATILEKAARICDAKFGNIFRWDGEALHLVATYNTPPAFFEFRSGSPLSPNPENPIGRLIATKAAVHIADLAAEELYVERHDANVVAAVELGGIRTFVAVPMLKENELIGAVIVYRQEVRPFTDTQIALVTSFASQAVIAIENTRLLNELRQRTTDLTEALEQQTATSEVLTIISSSPGELQPVFDALLANATRLCEASYGTLWLHEDDGQMRMAALHGHLPGAFRGKWRVGTLFRPSSSLPTARVFDTRKPVQIVDLKEDRSYFDCDPLAVASVDVGGIRSLIAVPMLKEGTIIGAMTIYRREVRPFAEKQIELVTNFAAQAVIAIENTRLLNELRQRTDDLFESLQQQTATSEILEVISNSPTDSQPAFDAIVRSGLKLFPNAVIAISLPDGDKVKAAAIDGADRADLEALRARYPLPLSREYITSTAILDRREMDFADARDTPAQLIPGGQNFLASGYRAITVMPMMRGESAIGAISVVRRQPGALSDKQRELLRSFANQAVIAIENTRLFNELRQRTTELTEALEQQTATADVLKVISRSQFDLQLVLDNLIQTATSLCGAKRGVIFRRDGDLYRAAAFYNATPELIEFVKRHPIAPGRHTITARVALERRVIHVADLQEDAEYTYALRDTEPIRTELGVPMFRSDDLVGVFILYKLKVQPFTDKQIELVTTFADQAVIAIENVRLLKELRERTEEVERLNQHLEQRVADQVGEIERMGKLRRFLPPQVADLIVASGTEKQLESHRREITALFCDLRGFTGFSESSDPEDVMALLRDYHAAIGETIIKYSGTLERYAGDGVMVIFNDPVQVDNPALRAVQMALDTREAMGALMEKWRELGHDVGFGIGIAHGFATLGTIGFEGRFDYAAIGTVSNVASRLCDEAKPGQILISPRVFTAVKDAVIVEPVGAFTLKGIARPLAAYNVLAATPPKI